MFRPKPLSLAVGLALAIAVANPALADTVVFDDDFAQGFSYSIFNFNNSDPPEPDNNPADISWAEFTILASGGNPAESLQLSHMHDLDRDGNGEPIGGDGSTFVQSVLENETVLYNPAAEGAFDTVTYSIDYRTASFEVNSIYFTMASQGSGSFRGFDTPTADEEWHTYTLTASQDDFSNFDFAGQNDLEFGFGFTTNVDAFDGPINFEVQVDNFRVTVSPVPEPTSISLLGLTGLAVFCRRRRA